MKKLVALVLSLALVLSIGVGAVAEGSKGTIKIGAMLGVTGVNAMTNTNFLRGVEQAVKNRNAAGGIRGYQLELVNIDSGDSTDTAINAVNLMAEENVVAVIGPHFSMQDFAILDMVESYKLPDILGGTNYKLPSEDNNYVFLGRTNDRVQAKVLATYLAQNAQEGDKVGILYVADDFGQGGFEMAAAALDEYGIEYISEPHNQGDTDYYSTLLKLEENGCNTVLMWSYVAPAVVIYRQMSELGLKDKWKVYCSPLMGDSSFREAINPALCEDVITVITTFYDTANPDVVAFGESFKETYGELPGGEAREYASIAMALIDAIERAEDPTSRDSVREALEQTKDFSTPFAKYTCDEKHMLNHSVCVCKWDSTVENYLVFLGIEQIV